MSFTCDLFSFPVDQRTTESLQRGSQTARKAAYDAFNRILHEEQPYNFGFTLQRLIAVPRNLQGPDFGSYAQFHNIEKWWFKQ